MEPPRLGDDGHAQFFQSAGDVDVGERVAIVLLGSASNPHLFGHRVTVDAADRAPHMFERRTVGAATRGRDEADGGVPVLVLRTVIVEVAERRGVRAVIDG